MLLVKKKKALAKKELFLWKKKKNNTECETQIHIPGVRETEEFILQTIKGQDEQVRSIVTSAYYPVFFEDLKSNVLIIGKSGTGKTEILKQLAQKVGKVCVEVDANEFTQEGYEGKSVNDILVQLLTAAKFDVEKAENGIVIIDEIDKKAGARTTERDISGRGVLNSMLKLVEGKTLNMTIQNNTGYFRNIEFRTDKIIFFFAGAFSGMEEIRKERLKNTRNSIGFSSSSKITQEGEETKYTKGDLVKYGLTEEFVSRMDTIVQMNDLSEQDFVEILKNSSKSRFRYFENALKKKGIVMKYSDTLFSDIAKKAKKSNTGARELTNIVNYIFSKVLYQIMLEPTKYKNCELLQGIESDNTKFILS